MSGQTQRDPGNYDANWRSANPNNGMQSGPIPPAGSQGMQSKTGAPASVDRQGDAGKAANAGWMTKFGGGAIMNWINKLQLISQPAPIVKKGGPLVQGDLKPITPATDANGPQETDLGQLTKQVFANIELSSFEVKTDIFGPYNPRIIPIWVQKLMRRDFAVKLGLQTLKAPLLKASRYQFVGGDPKIRAFLEKVFRPLLPKLLRTSFNAIDFGFSVHEIVWDENLPNLDCVTDDGVEFQIRRAVVPRKIADLDPEIIEILVRNDDMKFAGIEVYPRPVPGHQVTANLYVAPCYIPPQKTFLCSYQAEFGNLRGDTGMGPAYNPWWWKNVGYMFWGRFMERLGMGVYVGRAPSDSRSDKQGNRQDPIRYLMGLLLALRTGGVIVIPHEPDALTQENKWAVELLESKNNGEPFEKWIIHLTACCLRGMLLPDKLVTQDAGTGSYSQNDSSFSQFFSTQESIVEETFIEPFNVQLAAPCARYNFGDKADIPRLEACPIDPNIRKQYVELLKTLAQVPRSIKPDGKQVLNGACIDAIRIARMIDTPIRPAEEWPEQDPAFPAGMVPDPETGAANTPKSGPGTKGAGAKNDKSKTDAEKNGEKNPKDVRLSLGEETLATKAEVREAMQELLASRAPAQAPVQLNFTGETKLNLPEQTATNLSLSMAQAQDARPVHVHLGENAIKHESHVHIDKNAVQSHNHMTYAPPAINLPAANPTPVQVIATPGEQKIHVSVDAKMPEVPTRKRTVTIDGPDGTSQMTIRE